MKHNMTFLKRCLALVLALVMVASSSNLGFALKAFAVENTETVTIGELMADTYALTEAEKAFLKSGLLYDDYEVSYKTISDDNALVSIDTANKVISVEYFDIWELAQVRIIANNEVVETIDRPAAGWNGNVDANLVKYSYNGDAFTVEADLEVVEYVDKAYQLYMLDAAAVLKAGLANLAAIEAVNTELNTVATAIPSMGAVIDAADSVQISVSDAFVEAVEALEAQIAEHGTLALCALNAKSEPITKDLLNNGDAYEESLLETYEALNNIQNDPLYNNSILSSALKLQDPEAHTQWVAFKGVLADLLKALEPVAEDPWTVNYDVYLPLNLSDAEYAKADLLLAAITETTKVTDFEEYFFIDAATLRATQDLVSVTVEVVLMNVENVPDSDKLVTVSKNTVVLDFPENAHDYDVQNAIYDLGILEQATATFGELFVQGCFETDDWDLQLPETLTENMTLTITYTPNMYEVEGALVAGSYPYGYQLTLPVHEDAQKAYDYTINGELYRQGMIYVVTSAAMVDVEEVKAYTIGSLYAIIGECFGNKGAQAVLNSGALLGDEAIYYREPNVLEGDMHLENNELMVSDAYSSGYGKAQWIPYSYGLDGVVEYFAPGAATATWNGRSVNVTYKLPLADQTKKAAEVADIVNTIYAQYVDQKAGMDSLLGKKADVEQLTRMYLSGLKGIIGDFVFVDDTAKNQELRDYFIRVISEIQADCVTDGSGYLDILAMIKNYEANGMAYYYNNSTVVAAEVAELSSHLTDLVGDAEKEAALAKLLCDPGVNRPELVEKIAGLKDSMETIAAQLSETHEAIDTSSENLNTLIKALASAEGVAVVANGAPFVVSDEILVQDESAVVLMAEIVVDGKKYTVQGSEIDKYLPLTAAMIAELQAKVDAKLAELLGDNAKYYNVVNNVTTDLNWYLGEELTNNLSVKVTADAKQYTVKIDGEADQVITIHNTVVNLPTYPNEGETVTYIYVYYIADEELDLDKTYYEFSAADLDTLFVDGTYTIKRTVRDEAARRLAAALEKLNDNNAGNVYTADGKTMTAAISTSGSGVGEFAAGMLATGYDYIALNGTPFVYPDANDMLEISIQTLIDALLNDETFSEQTIIDLGNNNGGKVLKTTIQLGNYYTKADGTQGLNIWSDMEYVMSLNSVPSQMVDVAKALNALKGNLHFYSKGGQLVTELTLPEKVYEVYLTAMLAVGEVDTDDMNAINNEIAFMYVYDYINLVLGNEDITTQTFQNTLNMLDATANKVGQDLPNKDLTAYEGAFQAVRSVFNSVDITVNNDAPVVLDITATDSDLNTVIDGLNISLGAYETYKGMIKELKPGNKLEASATVSLTNTMVDFEALVIDLDEGVEGAKELNDGSISDVVKDNVKGNGLANSIDYTTDLFGRVSEVTGPAAIYLLADVKGDLVINHSTVLDLNGKTIDGNITVKGGKLVIIDSKVATTDAGTVTGKVTGNVTIVSGHYNSDVTAFLRDGYIWKNGLVQNAMYTIEREGTEFTVVLNSSFMEEAYVDGYLPSISAVAAEIALDTVLNFYIPANLNIEGNRIYGIDDDYSDIFAIARMSIGEFFDMNLANVRVDGLSNLTNIIIRDLCQFGDIADALENETKLASYTFQTNPWAVEFKHVPNGDYMTVGVVADDEIARDYTLSLVVVGDNIKKFIPYLRELDAIVVYDESTCTIDLKQPVRDGKHMVLEGGATAHLSLDLTVHGDDGIDHDVYKQILAVVFAYGNPDKASALVDAIGNDTELNAAFNDMTVREVINALGAMNRATSFAEMAAAVGATGKVSADAAQIEHLYHLVSCAVGKILVKLDSLDLNGKVDTAQDLADKVAARVDLTTVKTIVDKAGNVIDRIQAKVDLDSKLGALDQGDGTYLLYYAYSRSGSVDYRGWGADVTLTETSGMLKVKIFDEEDCLWGDANHDNLVNAKDATLVLQYSVDALEDGQFFCTKRTDVNGDGEINAKDATLILQHSVGTITKFPVEE